MKKNKELSLLLDDFEIKKNQKQEKNNYLSQIVDTVKIIFIKHEFVKKTDTKKKN